MSDGQGHDCHGNDDGNEYRHWHDDRHRHDGQHGHGYDNEPAANDDAAEVCFTCRAVLSALTQGSLVGGRYEILSPLGRGGTRRRSAR